MRRSRRSAGTAGDIRVYLSMVRAFVRDLGLEDTAVDVRVPRHEPGAPETLTDTDTDYANLLRVPDRRTTAGKHDYAVPRALSDCGLRSADLRGLRARDLRRPRANACHHASTCAVRSAASTNSPSPKLSSRPLEAWLKVHPLARGVGLLDDQSLFVRLGRHGGQQPLALSAVAVHRLVPRTCLAAGAPERLAHPHALRAYWATHLLEAGVPIHEVSARLGHFDLRTTARYAAPRPERVDQIAAELDRCHQAARRGDWGRRTTS